MDNKQKQQAIEYKEIEILFSEKSSFFAGHSEKYFCRIEGKISYGCISL